MDTPPCVMTDRPLDIASIASFDYDTDYMEVCGYE